jgi:HlyD family secretion protein
VVVAVDNVDQVLLPGMTANAEIEVSRRDDVLRVPNAALRYKPAEADPAAASAPAQRGGSPVDERPRIAAGLQLDAAQQAAFDTALQAMRERTAARTAAPVAAPAGSPMFGGPPRGGNANRSAGNSGAMRQRMQERFNQQFAGFRDTLSESQRARWNSELTSLLAARRAPLYKLVDGKPAPVSVRVGVSDGSWTEVSGEVVAGGQVVIGSGRPAE